MSIPYKLHNLDYRSILQSITRDGVAVVTDPPYGLGERMKSGEVGEWSKHWASAPEWDKEVSEGVETLVNFPYSIIWGGNYYPLPPVRGWLIWDKMQEHTSGHAELAWSNLDLPVRVYRLSRVEAYSAMNKQHPTQKPISLMKWCLGFIPENFTIFDPFMGSGSTGVAAIELGRRFIGCEINPEYYAIAEKRIKQAAQQPALLHVAQHSVQRTGGESGQQSLFSAGDTLLAKVTRQSTRR